MKRIVLLAMVTASCSDGSEIPASQWRYLYETSDNQPFFVDKASIAGRQGSRSIWVRFGRSGARAENWMFRCNDRAMAVVGDVDKVKYQPVPPDSIAADVFNGVCADEWPAEAQEPSPAAPAATERAITTNDVTAVDGQ